MNIKANLFSSSKTLELYDQIPKDIQNKLFPEEYFELIDKAKKRLSKKFFVILPSFSCSGWSEIDTGIGSLSEESLNFFKLLGFDGIITLPEGPLLEVKERDAIQYDTSPFNPLGGLGEHLASVEKLVSKEWEYLLRSDDLSVLLKESETKNKVDYSRIKILEELLDRAFINFQKLSSDSGLVQEFISFTLQNEFLDNDAIYKCLSREYNCEIFELWMQTAPDSKKLDAYFDQTLFKNLKTENRQKAETRLEEIKKKYKKEIERYKFGQFFLYKERKKLNEYAKEIGLAIIGNLKVAPPLQRFWDHPDCFLQDYRMGAAPEPWRNSETGDIELIEQRWGAPVFIPFDKKADELQRKLVREFFDLNDGGILDHAVKGSLNEYVYKPIDSKPGKGSRLCLSPENDDLKYYSFVTTDQVDNNLNVFDPCYVKDGEITTELVAKFAYPFKNIYQPVLEEKGINPSNFILETLGILTNVSQKVFDYVEKEYGYLVMTPFAFSDYSWDHPYSFQNATGLGLTNTHDTETINFRADLMSEEDLKKQVDGFQTLKEGVSCDDSPLCQERGRGTGLSLKDQYKILKQVEPWLAEKTSSVAISFVELTNGEPINFPGESGIWSEVNPNTKVWKSRMSNKPWEEIYDALKDRTGYRIAYSLALALQYRFPEEKELVSKLLEIDMIQKTL